MSSLRTARPAWLLSLLTAVFIVAANNVSLFAAMADKLPLATLHGAAFLALIACLMIATLLTLFLVVGIGPLLKPLLAATLLVSAILGYFTEDLGVVFDLEMLRNLAETVGDANSQEATELVSWPLALHVAALGLLPVIAVILVPLRRASVLAGLRARALCLSVCAVLTVALAMPNYKYLTYFSVENRDLRYQVTPIFAILSATKLLKRSGRSDDGEFHRIGADAARVVSHERRRVGVLMVGETARADHFSLGGYHRHTNPLLEHERGLQYYDIDACGTSTAFSVPCMFSIRGRDSYSPGAAKHESNVLDILDTAGVRAVWIDNNSSCKGVCGRIEYENLHADIKASSPWYSEGGYYDGVLLDELDRYLADDGSDLLIVLHMLGSHGPAYSRRYPPEFGRFAPSCEQKSPKECSDVEVVNAYDNTILYTDYILEEVIERLRAHDDIDSFMLYASDHGESLGENGVYLHGLPYLLAPSSQTRVPLILWLSPGMSASQHAAAVRGPAAAPKLSHDNISHTLLGLFDVSTGVYRPERDLFRDASHGP